VDQGQEAVGVTVTAEQLKVKIFADGASLANIASLAADPAIRGFTTNPTLMRQAGVDDYERFAHGALEVVVDRPISFEVFSDDFDDMEKQARKIAAWGENVFVKIPVTNTGGERSDRLIRHLAADGLHLNVTAVFTTRQVDWVLEALQGGAQSCISIFAGRVADAGVDPVPLMQEALARLRPHPHVELIWASPREVFNVMQADAIGCHIITVTHDLLKRLSSIGKDLDQFSLETVRMFRTDAINAGYHL
jgi:transaldolase